MSRTPAMSLSEDSLSVWQDQKAPQAPQDFQARRVLQEHLYIQSRCVAVGAGRAGVIVRVVKSHVRLRALPLPGAL